MYDRSGVSVLAAFNFHRVRRHVTQHIATSENNHDCPVHRVDMPTCARSECHVVLRAEQYQKSLAKVIGSNDVHRDEVMVLESQLSELIDEGWRCSLAQDLIHLSWCRCQTRLLLYL